MTTRIWIGAMIAILILSGCGNPERGPEAPEEALQAIIQHYENQDFEALVRTRYAEIGKADGEEQIQALIDRLKGRFSDEDRRNQAIAVYTSLLATSPEISESGDVAVYRLDQGSVTLSRMPDGKWGFHL